MLNLSICVSVLASADLNVVFSLVQVFLHLIHYTVFAMLSRFLQTIVSQVRGHVAGRSSPAPLYLGSVPQFFVVRLNELVVFLRRLAST